jgi:Fur family ferric uptake transcriptional regulator
MAIAPDFSLGKVDVALTPRERFAEFLQTRGKRVTRQRQVIVDHVSSHHEHFDAEQLLADLRRTPEGAKASRPTIYRTLTEMVDAGLLRKMVLGGCISWDSNEISSS